MIDAARSNRSVGQVLDRRGRRRVVVVPTQKQRCISSTASAIGLSR